VGNRSAAYAVLVVGIAVGAWMYLGNRPPGPAPAAVSSAAPSASALVAPSEPPAPQGPASYVFPPHVHGQNMPNGQYQTEVRFTKTAGPWPSEQESKFDVWFDGDVQKEFMSRGFEDPVNFDVKTPEPKHLSIRIKSPPIEIVTYVAFTFKSAKPVQVIKTDVSPKSEEPSRADH
jgi:hypothetical protein